MEIRRPCHRNHIPLPLSLLFVSPPSELLPLPIPTYTHTDNTRKGLPHEAELGLLRTSHKSLLSCHDQTSFEGMSMTMSFPTRSRCFCRLNDLTMSTASSLTGIRKKISARAMLRSFNQQNGGGLRLPQGPRCRRWPSGAAGHHELQSYLL